MRMVVRWSELRMMVVTGVRLGRREERDEKEKGKKGMRIGSLSGLTNFQVTNEKNYKWHGMVYYYRPFFHKVAHYSALV